MRVSSLCLEIKLSASLPDYAHVKNQRETEAKTKTKNSTCYPYLLSTPEIDRVCPLSLICFVWLQSLHYDIGLCLA